MRLTKGRIMRSKYLILAQGGIFAALAIVFFLWGLKVIFIIKGNCLQLTVPFIGMSLSIFLGLTSMLVES